MLKKLWSLLTENRNPNKIWADKVRLLLKLQRFPYVLVLAAIAVGSIGVAMLYSAAPNAWQPWASNHAFRLAFGIGLVLVVALTDIRLWFKAAYFFYAFVLLLLLATLYAPNSVSAKGGARWLDLGVVVQPSEFAKVALVLTLARLANGYAARGGSEFAFLFLALLVIMMPTLLILRQPDLGTALILLMTGIAALFATGLRMVFFLVGGGATLLSVPVLWTFLKPYQKQRVWSFLNPESDPLGSSYHIVQSKIALGSGGVFGKGLFQGTQGHLNFLPEKHTDFVFAMFAEELGFFGGCLLIGLYIVLLSLCMGTALSCKHVFGRVLSVGLAAMLFLYIFVNLGMVMNLLPVVGVPLPLVSYGGSAMLTVMIALGLVANVYVHRTEWLDRT